MSVRIMTQVWDLDLPASQKIVLLALADCANDEGLAWPGVNSLRQKCSKSERTVQVMLAELERMGHITRNQVIGKGCRYQIHPGGKTPAESAPRRICVPQDLPPTPAKSAGTPANSAPKPSKNHQEPSGGARGARASTPEVDPGSDDWVPPAVASLPDKVRALVEQWPAGAYQAITETFRLHWIATECGRRRGVDAEAMLCRWLLSDHAKVMRDARGGVSYAALAPAVAGTPTYAIPIVADRDLEGDQQRDWRKAIEAEVSTGVYRRFVEPAALIPDGDRVKVIVGSEFQRSWIEQNLADTLRKIIGRDLRLVVVRPYRLKQGVAGE